MAETTIGLGANPITKHKTKEDEKISKVIAEKDDIIANAEKTVLAKDKEISDLIKKIAEKDDIIVNAEETVIAKDKEISNLTKKIAELEKGGSANGTTSKNSSGGNDKSKTK